MQGRIVRVQCVDETGLRFTKVFDVGLEQEDMAITAVRIVRPELGRLPHAGRRALVLHRGRVPGSQPW